MDSFHYENKEIKNQRGGKKIVRKVSIKNGKGYKSITKYSRGKKIGSVRKPLNKSHIEMIKTGKFIPGLFLDCKCSVNKTRKIRK